MLSGFSSIDIFDAELLTESEEKGDGGIGQDYPGISYRRKIVPEAADFAGNSDSEEREGSHERQWEKLKDNKDSKNRNRRSHISYGDDDTVYSDKSSHGKWKKRKGPAPALPVPPKRVLQMLPLQEILHELEVIEVQQQGLEKQGIMLEKIIRERCEGESPEGSGEVTLSRDTLSNLPTQNTKEVEDLIMQLFDLVNEKNELFRRQAELMYLRRQHRLEQEQIDLEYEIRVLMAQPERNKTDSDKAKEEALISRLVEVVQLRNDVVDNLESDRLREAEEDLSIKQEIEKHTAKRDESLRDETSTKLSKKEKKKQKEAKKSKNKKIDVDKLIGSGDALGIGGAGAGRFFRALGLTLGLFSAETGGRGAFPFLCFTPLPPAVEHDDREFIEPCDSLRAEIVELRDAQLPYMSLAMAPGVTSRYC
uniref:Uncharacterized protein n=1 Tax=Phlebotomus papatasi TaxID=29031 RepID=A0A1B0DFQ7_PHLPP